MRSFTYVNGKRVAMESLASKSLKIAAVVAFYWTISISMVFLNKYLLSSKDLKLNAPFFITWFQCVVSVLLIAFFSFLAGIIPNIVKVPPFKIDPAIIRGVLPLSLVFVSMISFNNLCLKYVGVAFYYIGRSLTTVFNVVFTYLMLGQSTSGKAIACCLIIISGFLLGVNQEGTTGSLSLMGVFFGMMASACVALNSIFTKKVLPLVDNNVWRLSLYNNLNACVLFLPLIVLFGEASEVYNFPLISSSYFWCMMTVAGVCGFGIGYATGLQIQFTSPLTHNISGTAKACAQTVIACIAFSEVKPFLWWISNMVVLFGSSAYTEVKRREMKQQHELDQVKSVEKPKDEEENSLLPQKV
ncbi:hypothetical protein SNE40_014947 [Patella caerulea]|uniref:Sugar phosphate transporter domain-containing protein n=1 Tax=Patella caerulea TaxID=87958 RepID=A0AAN8PDU4_PATCE